MQEENLEYASIQSHNFTHLLSANEIVPGYVYEIACCKHMRLCAVDIFAAAICWNPDNFLLLYRFNLLERIQGFSHLQVAKTPNALIRVVQHRAWPLKIIQQDQIYIQKRPSV